MAHARVTLTYETKLSERLCTGKRYSKNEGKANAPEASSNFTAINHLRKLKIPAYKIGHGVRTPVVGPLVGLAEGAGPTCFIQLRPPLVADGVHVL